jgi:type I restriction enzyme, R subunit
VYQLAKWLIEMIRDHIAANLGIEPDDFEYAPFAQEGGLGQGVSAISATS